MHAEIIALLLGTLLTTPWSDMKTNGCMFCTSVENYLDPNHFINLAPDNTLKVIGVDYKTDSMRFVCRIETIGELGLLNPQKVRVGDFVLLPIYTAYQWYNLGRDNCGELQRHKDWLAENSCCPK